jgi:hypothetical protein
MRILLYISPINVDSAHIAAYRDCRAEFPETIPEFTNYCAFIRRHPNCGFLDFSLASGVSGDTAKEIHARYLKYVSSYITSSYPVFLSEYLSMLPKPYQVEVVGNLNYLTNSVTDFIRLEEIKNKVQDTFCDKIKYRHGNEREVDALIATDHPGYDHFIFDDYSKIDVIMKSKTISDFSIYLAGAFDLLKQSHLPRKSIFSIQEFFFYRLSS